MFFFASDLHGIRSRYDALASAIERESPEAVLLGGDLLPKERTREFIDSVLVRTFAGLRERMGERYPRVLLIFGNDDPRMFEPDVCRHALWSYMDRRCEAVGKYRVYGYPFVPPTPFTLKDWERYDVSHYVPPGATSPEDGDRSVEIGPMEPRYATIAADLEKLIGSEDVSAAIFLMHSPPYETALDRAALDGRMVDWVPVDVHVGSIAIRRFIENHQPRVTLHGHIHESSRLTGRWLDRIGRTVIISAAHEPPQLALVRFDPRDPAAATRELT